LLDDLNALVESDARGDPMSPLRWTCKSLRRLAAELKKLGHQISHTVVGELLKSQKFSLQADRKTKEGSDNPDRDAQFRFVNDAVETALAENQPVISVDTKKKELVGDFKNAGREWRPQGDPEEVRVHDFLIEELGRAVPYGVYDLAANTGWVNVGMDNDTAAFAVQTIRRWWREHRPCSLSAGETSAHYRRWRRIERLTRASVETRVAAARRRTRHIDRGSSPTARNDQMEQDRASPVLIHHSELARQTFDQLSRDCRSDRRDNHKNRLESLLRTRRQPLSQRRRRLKHRNGEPQHQTCDLPWRLELYDRAVKPIMRSDCFLTGP
jgi:hypothetical protein